MTEDQNTLNRTLPPRPPFNEVSVRFLLSLYTEGNTALGGHAGTAAQGDGVRLFMNKESQDPEFKCRT